MSDVISFVSDHPGSHVTSWVHAGSYGLSILFAPAGDLRSGLLKQGAPVDSWSMAAAGGPGSIPMDPTTEARPVPAVIHIVFDRTPPSSIGRYALTLGIPYRCELVDGPKRLFATTDDNGVAFNVGLYGRTYTNGGYWHIHGPDWAVSGGAGA